MRERPIIMSIESVRAILAGRKTQTRRVCKTQPNENWNVLECRGGNITYLKPPYNIGDRLWVKEKYYEAFGRVHYFADDEKKASWLWGNPMFMLKKQSRITLKVLDVRLDLLCQITNGDVVAEGFGTLQEYQETWDKLNAKRGFSWARNPWVWVIEFRKIEKERK